MKPRSDKHLPIETEQVYRNVDGTVAVERITREPAVEARPGRPARRPSLAGLLVGAGLTSYEQITEALEEGLGTGERLGEVIVRRGWASEDDLAQLLAEQWSVSYLDKTQVEVDRIAVERLPLERARELAALPIHYNGIELVVIVAEPADDRFAKVREVLAEVSFAVVARSTLEQLLADPLAALPAPVEHPAPFESGSLSQRLRALVDEVEQLEARVQRVGTEHGADQETIEALERELALRESLLEVLRAKLTDR